MAKRSRADTGSSTGTDSFTAVLRGDASGFDAAPAGGDPDATERVAPPGRGYRPSPRGDGDHDATERFGWGAPGGAGAYPHAGVDTGPGYGAPAATPRAPAGYTAAVDPLRERGPAPEIVLLRVRPHARRLTLPVLVLLATVTVYGYFGGRFAEDWQNLAALVGASALLFFAVLLPFIAWLGHRYTITSRRIIARTGLLTRTRRDLYLARVTDVRLRRTPLQALFSAGNVHVTAGPDLTVVLRDVPSARLVAAMLGELTEHPTPTFHRLPS
ncbi:PH domain-containing protein [Herbiconiux sp. A18JL235]|uniref:PH domain-containing protein n=1 Tax=Herbiconiux sp. A18JL235 TaxID=3152363 RepID=A0AB39BJD0_9MICO